MLGLVAVLLGARIAVGLGVHFAGYLAMIAFVLIVFIYLVAERRQALASRFPFRLDAVACEGCGVRKCGRAVVERSMSLRGAGSYRRLALRIGGRRCSSWLCTSCCGA
jgi:hypothetical protein